MTAIEAMDTVTKQLLANDLIGAQHAVLNIEKHQSVLPSSTFERVLKASVHADCLLPTYSEFCQRAYGRAAYANIVAKAKAA